MVHGFGLNASIFEAQTGMSGPRHSPTARHHPWQERHSIHSQFSYRRHFPYTSPADIKYTAPLRSLLPSHWEYYFLQAPLECGPAPGIGEIYPGQPYKCWFFVPSLKEFQNVHYLLEEAIEEEGPFDAAWGFSAVRVCLGLIDNIQCHHCFSQPSAALPPPHTHL